MDARQEVELIRKALKHYSGPKLCEEWLNTGSKRLHTVLGHPDRGLPYGKLFEISGVEGSGKSALVMEICAAGQVVDEADIGWIDAEAVWSDEWAVKRGLNPNKVAVFYPRAIEASPPAPGKKVKKKQFGTMRLMYAEELFDEAEAYIKLRREKNPKSRIIIGIDSLPALLPRAEVESGLDQGAMAVRAGFLTKAISLWSSLAASYNVMVFAINQIRTKPGVVYGDPTYTPGGHALRHFCSIRARVRRAKKGGKILRDGHQIGIKGFIQNIKNKTGGLEQVSIGYKIYFEGRSKFVDVADLEPNEKED